MGLLDDILKGLPTNPVLREKVSAAEAKYGALDTENAILKDDLRQAKAQITKLEKRIEELTHTPDLDETDVLLLKEIALAGVSDSSAEYIASRSDLIRRWSDFAWDGSRISTTSLLGASVALTVTRCNRRAEHI